MGKNNQEEKNRKKVNEEFNSVTQKSTPENQNQTHNSRKEGVRPNINRD